MMRFIKHIGRFSMAALAAAILCPAALGQAKANSAVKKGLSEIPSLVSLTSSPKVGERVRLVGTQFTPNESVTISFEYVDGASGARSPLDYSTAYADADGNFVVDWQIPGSGRFVISAKGSQSGFETSRIVESDLATPAPILVSGNPSCSTLNANNAQFPSITSNWGLKLDFGSPTGTYTYTSGSGVLLTGGAPSDPNNSVSVNSSGNNFSWSSTRPVNAVIIKGGSDANVYVYDPAALSDSGPLTTPGGGFAISHVEFCFQTFGKILVSKHASPPSAFQFDFTTTGLPGGGSFSLVDDSSSYDPFIQFVTATGVKTITESNPSPFTLVSINCVSQKGTSSIDVSTIPTATVNLASGDVVICTFNNDFQTAVEAIVQGKVVNQLGTPISGALVSATDGNGNTVYTRTNMFGQYSIGGLEAGTSLFLNVSSKGHVFGSRFVNLNGDMNNVDFVGLAR